MSKVDAFIAEFDREAATTRKLLERLPDDKMEWKPHEKSSTLGRLAMHIVMLPGRLAEAATKDDFSFGPNPGKDIVTRQDVLEAFDASIAKVHEFLPQISDERLLDRWTAKMGDKVVIDTPRIGVVRTMLLNHMYHHRGQLSVYMRLLEIPVPSIYGPSADENPFA
jgi:uncharacterized damage-inducible protein DinB